MMSRIIEDMFEELHDAKHRIKNAYNYKAEYPEIAKREYEIAVQELSHAEKDHASAVELVEKYRKEKKGSTRIHAGNMGRETREIY